MLDSDCTCTCVRKALLSPGHRLSSLSHEFLAASLQDWMEFVTTSCLYCPPPTLPWTALAVAHSRSCSRLLGLRGCLLSSQILHWLQARVEAAGGQILFWNGVRVMGVLAVSRAIGDHCLRPFVIAQPEV